MFTFLNLRFLTCFNSSEFFISYVYTNTLQLKFQFNATCSRVLREIDSERPLQIQTDKSKTGLTRPYSAQTELMTTSPPSRGKT